MSAVIELAPLIGIALACVVLGVSRATFYRAQQGPAVVATPSTRVPSPLALSEPERQQIREALHAPQYADCSARTVFARLLDAGCYLASVSSFYRILRADGEARPRRNQLSLKLLDDGSINLDKDFSLLRILNMKTSARNQFVGTVSSVRSGAVNDEVELTLPGGHPKKSSHGS